MTITAKTETIFFIKDLDRFTKSTFSKTIIFMIEFRTSKKPNRFYSTKFSLVFVIGNYGRKSLRTGTQDA